ncbi:Protoporphyrinogen oxidase [Eremomyces bilateralis CBS 781.70]|uniref:Protoporphyrinogen oxidase n=1 Tax=Eremomyces bilateralis CBS 781.70 TaxID=1392243 RepID=A0A6G1FT76_9PEZI|nr:Protoporphyrinogen oxidase [Eremomyces bilateralis CBS 781.70]KAF1808997.1 Protoporphyrinogen oxidase [Eremomyces bilateralis CBS 781.70]
MLLCANHVTRQLILRPSYSGARAWVSRRRDVRRHYSESNGPNIAILGGGITGLSTAFYLREALPSSKITIYEGSDRVGGWIRSTAKGIGSGDVIFEHGPRTLRPTIGLLTPHLIEDLGLAQDVIATRRDAPASTNRYIYYPDHLVRMPMPQAGEGISQVWNEPLFEGIGSALTEWFVSTRPSNLQDESVASFISRRLDRRMADNMVSALLHGIYAGDVNQLSMKSIFPLLWYYEGRYGSLVGSIPSVWSNLRSGMMLGSAREYQSILDRQRKPLGSTLKEKLSRASVYTLKRGLTGLVSALRERLLSRGVTIHENTPISALSMDSATEKIEYQITSAGKSLPQADQVISTVFSRHLANICKDGSGTTLLPSFGETHAVSVMVVNLFFQESDLGMPEGFGYLIPQSIPIDQNPERALGVIFDSCATSGQDSVSGTKLTVILGGHWWDGWTEFPDEEEGVSMARAILSRHLGLNATPTATQATLQRECIPQYLVGHWSRMEKGHQELKQHFKGKLKVAGSSYTGVGVNDCIQSARNLVVDADELAWKDKTGLEEFTGDLRFAEVYFRTRGE